MSAGTTEYSQAIRRPAIADSSD